jgi:flavorubredoxin
VGVFNPNMRIFDIVMSTQYGTTYNAYLIKDEKNVLVDTTHSSYCEQFFKNINEILPIEKIDYLVVNHCEPDHAGCVQKITATNPKIKILCSQTSAIFLKKICNQENLNIQVVTDGQEIDIGSKKLKFIIAPFLH